MKTNPVDVSIIYVNHNSAKYLTDSILSVIKESSGFNYEFVVVDNSESEEEAQRLKDLSLEFGFKLIFTPNEGFGCANNAGSKVATGKYLHFLNCDTRLINNAIFELYSFLENNPNCGVVGSNLYSEQLTPNFSMRKVEKNIKNEKKYNSIFYLLRKKNNTFNMSDEPLKVSGYVSGASLMMSKETFNKVGGFPKEIFMYGDDVFLCYKVIHQAGLDVYNVPSSKIIHLEGKSKIVFRNRIELCCNSDYLYYKMLFGEKDALEYLRISMKVFKRNKVLSRLMLNKSDAKKFKDFYEVYKEKYLEVKGK